MITDIQIENFRCFHKSHIKGFKRINLIGGKNNSGKTAFLEAVYLSVALEPSSLFFLNSFRQIDIDLSGKISGKSWDYLFLSPNNRILLSSKPNKDQLTFSLRKYEKNTTDLPQVNEERAEYIKINETPTNTNKHEVLSMVYLDASGSDGVKRTTWRINSNGKIEIDNSEGGRIKRQNINFIPSSFKATNSYLAEQFDITDLAGNSDKLLKAFQIVDSSIIGVKTMSIGKPTIYLQTKEGGILPIGLFGDAINKIANLILKIANNPDSIILIDEIENGIHYTNQVEVWEMIFKLAEAFEVQIFATTHSIEMIKAFANVLKQDNNAELGGYFEFYRHRKTNEIAVNEHVSETLIYELENNLALRGE